MKNYNKILEAVNRGIQLALDDFDDDEPVLNIKSKQIIHRDYTKEYLDLMKDAVDLGLPSRTLWCKYNLGVDLNLLSKVENWYGDYYAWGESEPNKPNFNWTTYKYGKTNNKLTKYCNNPEYGLKGFTDNLTLILPEDDAAYLNKKLHNFKFHIPTKEQCEELIKYTNRYWINNYNPNKSVHNHKDDKGIQGLNGQVFTSKVNGNTLFIPAGGYRDGSNTYDVGSICCLWTSSLDSPNEAYYLIFDSGDISIYNSIRYSGYSIRPVINL